MSKLGYRIGRKNVLANELALCSELIAAAKTQIQLRKWLLPNELGKAAPRPADHTAVAEWALGPWEACHFMCK